MKIQLQVFAVSAWLRPNSVLTVSPSDPEFCEEPSSNSQQYTDSSMGVSIRWTGLLDGILGVLRQLINNSYILWS